MSTGELLTLGVGLVMWAVIVGICLFGKRPTGCCPVCMHPDAANAEGRCSNFDSYSGWGSDVCGCDDDYHKKRRRSATEKR